MNDTNFIGKNPYERSLKELFEKGYINIDKDSGPTSHQCVDNLKGIFKLKKAGHSGTLDPKVTGVLLTGLGKATRLMEYMLKSDKEYVCLCYFHKPVSKEKVLEAFEKFTGVIKQLPPIVSAVRRIERERTIYSLSLLNMHEDSQHVLFRVSCQHGTYIRKLCTDLGLHLGMNAQMKELRRAKAGPLTENQNCIGLDKLRNLYVLYLNEKNKTNKELFLRTLKTYIRPQEELLCEFKYVTVKNTAVNHICHGDDLFFPGSKKIDKKIIKNETVILYTELGELIGIGKALLDAKNVDTSKKGIFIKTQKILMEIDYFPKIEKIK